jgi:tetratricopeptide (TPR) repeat protein
MWAEHESYGYPLNWQQASDYCATLKLGGFSGWRLPTLDETKAIETVGPRGGEPSLKGQTKRYDTYLWTSTPSPKDTKTARIFPAAVTDLSDTNLKKNLFAYGTPMAALCVRPMEADILQVAKDAQVNHPVPDLQTLKANVPLNTARLAFKTGQYQESIAQALDALSIKSKFAPAYWSMGISYGMLGQWDQAVSNLKSALKIDKKYKDAKTALKWAKDCQKAAKNGKSSKDKPPVWE